MGNEYIYIMETFSKYLFREVCNEWCLCAVTDPQTSNTNYLLFHYASDWPFSSSNANLAPFLDSPPYLSKFYNFQIRTDYFRAKMDWDGLLFPCNEKIVKSKLL